MDELQNHRESIGKLEDRLEELEQRSDRIPSLERHLRQRLVKHREAVARIKDEGRRAAKKAMEDMDAWHEMRRNKTGPWPEPRGSLRSDGPAYLDMRHWAPRKRRTIWNLWGLLG